MLFNIFISSKEQVFLNYLDSPVAKLPSLTQNASSLFIAQVALDAPNYDIKIDLDVGPGLTRNN